MPDLPQPVLWEQQPGENDRWFARFERFRMAGPNRSVLGTVNLEQVDKGGRRRTRTPGSWDRAAKRWRWKERADAWDQYQLQAAREAHAAQVREMHERHVQMARGLHAKAVERLRSLSPADLSSQDLLRYLVEAAKLERLALGEPDSLQRQELTGSSTRDERGTRVGVPGRSTNLMGWSVTVHSNGTDKGITGVGGRTGRRALQ